jgi:hypothetical protein
MSRKWVLENLTQTGGFLFGRRTYEGFPDDGVLRPLRLVESQVTTTGAILATYSPAEG